MPTEKIISPESGAAASSVAPPQNNFKTSAQWKSFWRVLVILAVCFSMPLFQLAKFAWSAELYSYILLMPFICWYLVNLKKAEMPQDSKAPRGLAMVFMLTGAGVLAYYSIVRILGGQFEVQDGLALTTSSFFLFFIGAALALLGRETMRIVAFPFGMMVFMVPMPAVMEAGVETFLQYGSAYVADGMFKLSGLNYSRQGLLFILPGMPDGIMVAPECSGIHSTLILLITSLLAGYLFLRSPRNRWILALSVLPLGLLRNGFRVFTISELCVHYGPQMINSPIHRKGGPLFFALSLVPFFALLVWLYKSERRRAGTVKA